MIARLYSNENFPQPVVAALRGFGHDVLTSRDAGKANDAIPDEEVLRYATTDQRAVITHNRQDFIHLHRLHPDHHGIITASSRHHRLHRGYGFPGSRRPHPQSPPKDRFTPRPATQD